MCFFALGSFTGVGAPWRLVAVKVVFVASPGGVGCRGTFPIGVGVVAAAAELASAGGLCLLAGALRGELAVSSFVVKTRTARLLVL